MRRVVTIEDGMTDIIKAKAVQILTAKHQDGYRVWINVDGECLLRIQRIEHLEVIQG